MERCPNCRQLFTRPAHSGDFVHQCNSGNKALDEEDYVNLNNTNWNLKGAVNPTSPIQQAEGIKIHNNRTARGKNAEIFDTRQHYEYIE